MEIKDIILLVAAVSLAVIAYNSIQCAPTAAAEAKSSEPDPRDMPVHEASMYQAQPRTQAPPRAQAPPAPPRPWAQTTQGGNNWQQQQQQQLPPREMQGGGGGPQEDVAAFLKQK